MKNIILLLFILVLLNSCSKSGGSSGGGTQPVQEPAVAFSIDASNASVSPGSTFQVTVTLTSVLPSGKGINIVASVTDQTNNNAIAQNTAIISTSTKNTITLINLPEQHWCNATIKVSSVATPSNASSQSFTVVFK